MPEIMRRAAEWYSQNDPNGGITDLTMERAKRQNRAAKGEAIGTGIGTGAGALIGALIGNPLIGASLGGMVGRYGGQAAGYNWAPVQDAWKGEVWEPVKDLIKW